MNKQQEFSEDQRDCLQEICNIAMGQAADSLARLLERFITLSVPAIRFISSDNLDAELNQLIGASTVSAVRQGFFSAHGDQGLRGESIIVFSETDLAGLAELTALEDEPANEMEEEELLLDIANVLCGACLNGIAAQLEQELGYSAPSMIGVNIPLRTLVNHRQVTWDQALSIKIGYSLESHSFQCDMLLLLPTSSVDELKRILDLFLED
ncbi:MAG: chemotaxis protein CheC [Motiliproteus sp.]|nr:chemotaxis protein CheC [Motiliproteus sp.]MCW9050951.1 chemotaxis protein CheC [Motiliproteus sp.]